MNVERHRLIMTQILTSIFKDKELAKLIAFKGGTSLMLFHGLTRFSTDLDFNILDDTKVEFAYKRLLDICGRFGKIDDCALKFYGPLIVIQYEKGGKLLKVEASIRQYDNHYEPYNILGTEINVMTKPDMFAHKLCALADRTTPRDIYDVWFFLKKFSSVNSNIIRIRTGQTVSELAKYCATKVREQTSASLMQGLGEVILDKATKKFVKNNLIDECASSLEIYSMYPQMADQPLTKRLQFIDANPEIITKCEAESIDLSTVSERQLENLFTLHQTIHVHNRHGDIIELNM